MRSGRFWLLPLKQSVDGPSATDRGHAQACSLGRHLGGSDGDRRHLWDELQVYPGDRVLLRLLCRDAGHRPDLRASVLALSPRWMALKGLSSVLDAEHRTEALPRPEGLQRPKE